MIGPPSHRGRNSFLPRSLLAFANPGPGFLFRNQAPAFSPVWRVLRLLSLQPGSGQPVWDSPQGRALHLHSLNFLCSLYRLYTDCRLSSLIHVSFMCSYGQSNVQNTEVYSPSKLRFKTSVTVLPLASLIDSLQLVSAQPASYYDVHPSTYLGLTYLGLMYLARLFGV
jgi:hypothetical protein